MINGVGFPCKKIAKCTKFSLYLYKNFTTIERTTFFQPHTSYEVSGYNILSYIVATTFKFVVNFWAKGATKSSIKHEYLDQPM